MKMDTESKSKNTDATQPVVTVIPARDTQFLDMLSPVATRRKVAAYARVSTNDEEQLTSYETQVKYYTEYIKNNPAWDFVEVYADEGISGTSTKRRDGFNRMVADALDGKIDLIITKSVSRFARNTVDSLITVRQLKEKSVEVFFEKENIYTLDSKGELLITIMSSLAQEESRAISENVAWGQRKRFADGKVSFPYKQFLGYEKGADGLPKIVETEAATVRLIYRLFMEGKTPSAISKHLMAQGVLSPAGKEKWQVATVLSILQNEKYKGDALLQKGYTVDFLTKKRKKNEGEMPQFYVKGSHPAIIEPDEFDAVQAELERRSRISRPLSCKSPFSTKVVCGKCGGFYGSKVWHSTSKYRRVVWRCNEKYKDDQKCETPHINEDDLKRLFIEAFNLMYSDQSELAENYNDIIAVLADTSALEESAAKLTEECDALMERLRESAEENTHTAQNQKEQQQHHGELIAQYKAVEIQLDSINDEKQARIDKIGKIKQFIADISNCDGFLTEFDEGLWHATVETVTVNKEIALFNFKDGTTIEVNI